MDAGRRVRGATGGGPERSGEKLAGLSAWKGTGITRVCQGAGTTVSRVPVPAPEVILRSSRED